MNRADRVAAQRAAAEQQARIQTAEAAADGKRADIDRLAAELEVLIPAFLGAKEAADYEGICQIDVSVSRAFGRRCMVEKGAYLPGRRYTPSPN